MGVENGIQLYPDVTRSGFIQRALQVFFEAFVIALHLKEIDARRARGDGAQASLADGIKGVVRIVPVRESQPMGVIHGSPAFDNWTGF